LNKNQYVDNHNNNMFYRHHGNRDRFDIENRMYLIFVS